MSVVEYLRTFSDDVVHYEGADVSLHVQGLIGWVLFSSPTRPVNVVNISLLPQVEAVLDRVDSLIRSKALYFLVFTSAKPHSFIAGADIAAMYPSTDQPTLTQGSRTVQSICNRIEALPVPTLSAINGPALGAGLELALACDYRVCSDDRRVVLGLPEVKLGLIPGSGGTVRLPELIGLREALGLILNGGNVRPQRAKKIGLVDSVIEEGDRVQGEHRFWSGVRSYATQHMGRGKRSHPSRLKVGGLKDRVMDGTWLGQWVVAEMAARRLDTQTKGKYPAPYFALDSAVQSAGGLPRKQSFELEARYFGRLGLTPESKALMALFYLMEEAKKLPQSIREAQATPVKRVAVIGAGVMGAQIAFTLASRRISVYLRDIQQPIVDRALQQIEQQFTARVTKGKLKEAQATTLRALVTGGTDLAPLSTCDLVLEAAVESLPLKQKILAECEQHMSDAAVFATNTSSLSIAALASASRRPGKVVGIHFFQPVVRMPLVEVIGHGGVHADTLATAYRFVLGISKVPVLCADAPGFIVNRCLGIYMNEAGRLLLEGYEVAEIDEAMKGFGLPFGPFRLMDEVGLDVVGHVGPILEAGLGPRFAQLHDFQAMLKAHPDTLGKKTGKGFYLYDDSENPKETGLNPLMQERIVQLRNTLRAQTKTDAAAAPHSSPSLSSSSSTSSSPSSSSSSPSSATSSSPSTSSETGGLTRPAPSIPILSSSSASSSGGSSASLIVERCVLLMVNEAVYMLGEGVAASPGSVDLAMILGTGFPPFQGGVLAYADSRGVDEVLNRLLVLTKLCGERFRPAEELVRRAERGERFFPTRPDPRRLKKIDQLPRSRL